MTDRLVEELNKRIAELSRRQLEYADRLAESIAARTGRDLEDVRAEVYGKIEMINRKYSEGG